MTKTKNDMQKIKSWLGSGCLLAVVFPNWVQAANITVDEGICTLADAITSANTDTATGGCVAGVGKDTIILQDDVILGATLPQISSTLAIEGGGHFISGNNDSTVGTILRITSSGNLTLNETAVKDGNTFPSEETSDSCGGIANYGIVTVTNSTINGNTTHDDGMYHFNGGRGGGIYNSYNGKFTLINSTINGNIADYSGGGIENFGTFTLTNSTVSGNTGGAIENWSIFTMTNSTVRENIARKKAVIDNYGGTFTLIDSTISDNTGGGIENWGTFMLTSSTVSNNSRRGIYNGETGTFTLTNSTISGNSGGILNNSLFMLTNSTVSSNARGKRCLMDEIHGFGPIKCMHSCQSNGCIRSDQMHAFVPIKWVHSIRP